MPSFQVGGNRTAASTTSPLNVTGSTTVRPRLVDFTLSTTGAPSSDAGVEVQLRRSTTAGTGTSVTPTPADSASAAATSTALSNLSAEPTYSSGFVKDVAFNPRATHRWVAYDQRAEVLSPATASNGWGFQCATPGGGGTILVDAAFIE